MAPSQLAQLKAALNTAGLSRKTHSKKDKKAYKKGGARETDRAKKLEKLEEIRKNLNKFDERETRVKHDVGGRNLKGVVGKPSASKQAGLEQRKKTLLPEHQLRDHRGTFRDRRFGENDPSMSIEDRMLERYTRERQRGQGKKGMFNLEDEDEPFGELDDGFALGGLTHGGRSVMDLPGDDFVAQGLADEDEDEEENRAGRIDKSVVSRVHFGGFEEAMEEDLPEKKKSKQEVMAEIIAKSKEHKYERQQQREMDAELREELDDDIADLQMLLAENAPTTPAATLFPTTSKPHPTPMPIPGGEVIGDGEYDQIVRSLAFDARAKPKNRTKTEEELAFEEKENLEKAEAKRLRRMRGESVSDGEEEEGSRKKRKADDKKPDADDLEDDYVEDEALLGPGLTREQIETMVLSGSEAGSDGEQDDEDSREEEESVDEDAEEEDESDAESAMEDLNESEEVSASESEEVEPVVKRTKGKKAAKAEKVKEIPYTFPCPANIEEFEEIVDPLEDSALPTVVQRIRALYHPSLAQGNKEKLQDFLGVLIDYVLILSSRPSPPFSLIQTLVPHLTALAKLNPITAAAHFVEKIKLMQKNLSRGLARGATRPDSKTFPGAPELALLRLVGLFWSTSDYSHPVVVPAVLLMGQYLSQSRVRSLRDLTSGLFLCSLLAQYESLSKRILPEAINFVASSILVLLPRRKGAEVNRTYPDLKVPSTSLYLNLPSSVVPSQPLDLGSAITAVGDQDEVEAEQLKGGLVVVACRLVDKFAGLYLDSEAFVELMSPVKQVLEQSRTKKLSSELNMVLTSTLTALSKRLSNTLSTRRPLTLQSHKPIPIASYAPRFEENFAPGKHYDPDTERNASAKLKALYKKERKGAIRELRKDNRFLAGEKAREQGEKDKEYNARMRKAEGSITVERAEEKAMEREKAKEKRRAGRG
ncbi:nucleolar protein 14 [Cryptococcus neoformans C23]|uniref:Nucleolar protein 14 n=2 Tax=Cryptococcus neoformans TaxID=5207 RepID=A0A854QP56_CRYNE|nr:nucleolar protein 14 [Cryptococcus neoformans var. grubii H99]AUB22847.1 nucleolar protein 14 [Cryptococcus neoformans var. grubii]OWZ34717.1 nucleolar protein 14 [Cryptococcus neoformans var. grubii AD2-60a]OWZ46816.1 nucleolar protein 14 [Cryptococcus neoformans var. grubii C23]OWZ50606.1 nucleolar protein 14 [Cryptococcus neoformans var. grubii AD1-83a]OWZ56411.1 nucleolar protein 14 [Cryptococcus neoformans var. grubii 125.91]OXC86309.1 nucleolar protein 14 [Cryptococcus neoformans var|eukprot:XP_012047236.1 nucleolar protein 14 [Cryptococcus neoformans var. grubii H99]